MVQKESGSTGLKISTSAKKIKTAQPGHHIRIKVVYLL